MNQRLSRELALLYAAEAAFKIPAAPVARQLIADDARPLPDKIPIPPAWKSFEWPSGELNFERYWKEIDRERSSRWTGPYL